MPVFKTTSIEQYTTISRFCQIAWVILLIAVLVCAIGGTLWMDNRLHRGVAWGPELPRLPQADVPPLGVNLFLDREPDEQKIRTTLELAQGMGAHWVKQQFPWDQIEPTGKGEYWDERFDQSTWQHYDRIVELCQEYGLELIVRLDRPPSWARPDALQTPAVQTALQENPDRDITGPPDDLADYGDYVYAVVSRYRGQVGYVQLWNEPNLANEWNWAPIDPDRFVELLRIGYTRAKEANPDVVVLFPSLAPNDGGDPRHMSDLAFLQAVYEAGGRDYFDVMSAQLYGLGQPPTERSPVGLDRQNLRLVTRTDVSRVVLLREIMQEYGDVDTPIWVGELGWNATPSDWTGRPSPWGPSVDEETKGRYIVEALDRSLREWPWMGVHNLWFLLWNGPPPHADDPTRFFALVDSGFTPLSAYEAVRAWSAVPPPMGIGYHDLAGPAHVESTFVGTRLDLVLPAGADPQSLQVEVDGDRVAPRFWRDEGGEARYIAVEGLADRTHSLEVSGPEGLLRGTYVVREQAHAWLFPTLTGLLCLALLAAMAVLMVRLPAALTAGWTKVWQGAERFRALPEVWQALTVLGGMGLCLLILYWPALLPLSLIALVGLVVLAALRLDLALCVAVVVIPLYPQPATVAGRTFSPFELTILACLGAAILQVWQEHTAASGLRRFLGAGLRRLLDLRGMALPSVVFVVVCAGSLFWATDRAFITDEGVGLLRISARELRVTVFEPVLLYPLLSWAFSTAPGRQGDRRGRVWWYVDALIVSGTLVGLGGIAQVLGPWHAEVADGVRRASSVYGTFSPNSLALFLGRVLALAVVGGAFLPRGRRKWSYLAALPFLGGAFLLTYSRGGLIAMAVVLLLYGLLYSRPLLWLELVVGAGGLLFAWATGGVGRLLAVDTFRNRVEQWGNTWELVREQPLRGLGLDAYYHHYHRRFPDLVEAYWTPHNVVLEFWTRLGVLGLAVGAWLYGVFFLHAGRLYRRLKGPVGRVLTLGLLGSVAYALAHGLLDGAFFAPDWAATFWLAYGLVAVLREDDTA